MTSSVTRLGLAEPGDFLRVFAAAVQQAEIGVALEGDSLAAEELGIDQGERAIADGVADAGPPQALGRGLGGGRFPIAGKSALAGAKSAGQAT